MNIVGTSGLEKCFNLEMWVLEALDPSAQIIDLCSDFILNHRIPIAH